MTQREPTVRESGVLPHRTPVPADIGQATNASDPRSSSSISKRQRTSMFVEWGDGGRAALMMSRIIREYRGDKGFANPLTPEELAVLLDHFKDTAIPLELRAIVQNALRGKRKAKPGPKTSVNPIDQLQEALLAIRYAEGMANGTKLRNWLKQRQKKQRRNARPYSIPTARQCACHHVRKWLPKFRGMTDASISNELSERRDTPDWRQRRPSGGAA